jgi:hypothetical protein
LRISSHSPLEETHAQKEETMSHSSPKRGSVAPAQKSNSATRATTAAIGGGGPSSESHRIYWQQWIGGITSGGSAAEQQRAATIQSRRELITSSAAVRLSRSARAVDVTDLLRRSIPTLKALNDAAQSKEQRPLAEEEEEEEERDCLVLVGTLYSLPRDYVQFEHELGPPHASFFRGTKPSQQRPFGGTAESAQVHPAQPTPLPAARSTRSSSSSDPFHVVRTLEPSDRPLAVGDAMRRRLQTLLERNRTTDRTIISPKLQWYYVPAADPQPGAYIPNCLELDGYCTSMDDGDEEESETEAAAHKSKEENDEAGLDLFQARFSWLRPEEDGSDWVDISDDSVMQKRRRRRKKREREERLFQEMTYSSSAVSFGSGYLLKRDARDPHVWRRTHCVCTEDDLWYVSRMYGNDDGRDDSRQRRYARHGRIRLTRALLLEPTADYAPLFRIPYAFEVVSGDGTSHTFRAANKRVQQEWIQLLSGRIVQSYENSLLDHAELIVQDECLARNRRMTSGTVEPLWEQVVRIHRESSEAELDRVATTGTHVGTILRWSMEVAEYRECCRYIQSVLPAKKSVVVVSATAPRRSPVEKSESVSNVAPSEPVEGDVVLDLIHACWERAATLLARATHVALRLHPQSPDSEPKLSHAVETLCRHIEYVITGRFRPLSPGSVQPRDVHQDGPPPIDLFDPLLAELQSLAAATDYAIRYRAGTQNGTATVQQEVRSR